MKGSRRATTAIVICALACTAGVASFVGWRGINTIDVRLLVIVALFGSFDLADVVLRLYFRGVHTSRPGSDRPAPTSLPLDVGNFTPVQIRQHLRPYAIVASVHNAEAELDDFLESTHPYREHLFVIDDASTDDTYLRLQQAGVRCIQGAVNRKKPGALRELVASLDPEIITVVVLDPDSRIVDSGSNQASDLERTLFEFQRSGLAAMCPCLTVRGEGLLGRFQQLEYQLAFVLGRYSLLDHCVTSGIAVYRRDALARVLDQSLSVYAEDLKNAYLLLADGERIYYDGRLVVETAGKKSWSSWFSQRVGWYFGLLKVYAESLPALRRWAKDGVFFRYHFVFYTGVCGILLQPIRLLAFGVVALSLAGGLDQMLGLSLIPRQSITDPAYFLVAYLQGTTQVALALAATFEKGKHGQAARGLLVVPLYFFYALAHVIPVTVGYLNWLSLRLFGRRVYRDHYQDDATLLQQVFGPKP